ncbi:hypothetical protein H8959_009031 [Pygathrix nigripes]
MFPDAAAGPGGPGAAAASRAGGRGRAPARGACEVSPRIARGDQWLLLSVLFLRAPLRAAALGTDPPPGHWTLLARPRAPASRCVRRGSGGVQLLLGRGTGPEGLGGHESPASAAFVFQRGGSDEPLLT